MAKKQPCYKMAQQILDYSVVSVQIKKRDRCGMYPKKTLSAAALLSECERKRCRSLEARGAGDDETLLT